MTRYLLVITLFAATISPALAGPLPPGDAVFGQSLASWLSDYWRWNYRNSNRTEPYQPGMDPMLFLPIPNGDQLSGDWTPANPAYLKGQVSVTVAPGMYITFPAFAWTAERYNPESGIPDDPMCPDALMPSIVTDPVLTLDGAPLLQNFWDYYVPATPFNPIVQYPDTVWFDDQHTVGVTAALAFQGVGFISSPLSPGPHVITLYEKYVVADGMVPGIAPFGVIYDNTWNIDVTPEPPILLLCISGLALLRCRRS